MLISVLYKPKTYANILTFCPCAEIRETFCLFIKYRLFLETKRANKQRKLTSHICNMWRLV